ncbi:MAG TPA: hypothetical protein VLK58_26370 [Conexibacter sp.]|nr:hypothetical protein [Conexibacter sp.]
MRRAADRRAAATSPPRAAPRSSGRVAAGALALAAALLLLLALPAVGAAAAEPRFLGQVTDALRAPAHKLAAGDDGRALAELVFLDREQDATSFRTCVRRIGRSTVRTCFTTVSGDAGAPTITPLRFQRGRYAVSWSVAGEPVAGWRFRVV